MGDGEYKEGHLAPALPRCIYQSSPSNKQNNKNDSRSSLQPGTTGKSSGRSRGEVLHSQTADANSSKKVLLLVLESQQSDSALLVIYNQQQGETCRFFLHQQSLRSSNLAEQQGQRPPLHPRSCTLRIHWDRGSIHIRGRSPWTYNLQKQFNFFQGVGKIYQMG